MRVVGFRVSRFRVQGWLQVPEFACCLDDKSVVRRVLGFVDEYIREVRCVRKGSVLRVLWIL